MFTSFSQKWTFSSHKFILNDRNSITRKYAINRRYLVFRRTTRMPRLANRRHAQRHYSVELKPITRPLVWIHRRASRIVTPVWRRAFLRLLIGPRLKVSLYSWYHKGLMFIQLRGRKKEFQIHFIELYCYKFKLRHTYSWFLERFAN